MAWYDNRVYSGTFACSGYSPEVADVGDAVEHNYERQHSGFEQLRHEMVKSMVFNCAHHGYDALMVLACDAVQTFARHALYNDSVLSRQFKKLCGEIAGQVFLHHDLVDLFSGLYGLDNGSDAEDIVGGLHCC